MCVRKPILIDCDPGHDDAINLMLAFSAPDELDVLSVTTVAGNQSLDKTTHNALRILSFLGMQVDVAAGSSKPMLRQLRSAPEVHGDSGLEGPYVAEPTFGTIPDKNAFELMADKIRRSQDKVTLVPTGPLTNIAVFLLAYPELHDRIHRIVLMGGSGQGGNWTAAAEFNIWVDPEAAQVVFNSGIPITMCGLDVTHKALIYPEEVHPLTQSEHRVKRLVGELLEYFGQYHKKIGLPGIPLHDPCTVMWLLYPEIFKTEKYHVDIEVSGEFTTGATVIDFSRRRNQLFNVDVVLDVNRELFIQKFIQQLEQYPANQS